MSMNKALQHACLSVMLMIDEDGEYVVGRDLDELAAEAENEGLNLNRRIVCLEVNVALPELVEESAVSVDVPDSYAFTSTVGLKSE